jgi:hypothetical protein
LLFPGNFLSGVIIEKLFWGSRMTVLQMAIIAVPLEIAINAGLWVLCAKVWKFIRVRLSHKRVSAPLAGLVLAVMLVGGPVASAADKATTPNKADRIVIVKSTHTMKLLSHGQVLKTYKVALGRGGSEAKSREGDRETPEGQYVIDAKNPHSRFHRSLHISYPSARDRERARKLGVSPGGLVEIHGIEEKWAWVGSLHREVDWTAGCIAVTNPEIDEIYKLVPVGTPVEIRADEKAIEQTDTVDPKTGNLTLTVPLLTPKPSH